MYCANYQRDYSFFYENTISVLRNTILSLKENINDDSLKKCTNQAINELQTIKDKLSSELSVYKENSNWDVFSIALYGETNAGKSTIIETLRILLNEKTKLEERKEFNRIKITYDNYVDHKKTIVEEISKLEEELRNNRVKLEELKNRDILDKYIDDWIAVQLIVWHKSSNLLKIMSRSFFDFIRVTFNKTKEQNELIEFKEKLFKIQNDFSNEQKAKEESIELYSNSINEIVLKMEELNSNNKSLDIAINNSLDELEMYSDGKIINKDIDFTKEFKEYEFIVNNVKFSLLDLPGIEGKEEIVQDEIKKALATAHAVLYISSKQRMPQKGDGSNEGTIEKISEQLSTQTEVYFIFNKRALNPAQMSEQLETFEDKQSLKAVDKGMSEIMPVNYIGSRTISAYPAFVLICNNVVGPYLKSKEKFLAKLSNEEILEKSGINSFVDWITNDLASNARNKIISSNFNKIICCNNLAVNVANDYIDNLETYKEEIENDLKDVRELLKTTKNNYINTICNYLNKHKRHCIILIRKEMYSIIDKGTNNSELSKTIKDKLKAFEKGFLQDSTVSINNYSDTFKNDVQKILNNHFDYIETINDLYAGKFSAKSEYSFELDIPTKGSFVNIVLSIASFVAAIVLAPDHGIIATILAIGSALLSFGKEVIAFFDHDYKISQQKNSVDKRLEEVSKSVEERVKDFKKETGKEIDKRFDELYDRLNITIDSANELLKIIQFSRDDILNEIVNLKREEEKLYECN